MKKGKWSFLFFVLWVAAGLGWAAQPNQQKIYPVQSQVVDAIRVLYLDQGLAQPSGTAPYSQAELAKMLEKIDQTKLSSSARKTYQYIEDTFAGEPQISDPKGVSFTWGVDATLEGYAHTNTADFVGRGQWVRGFLDQKPALTFSLESWPGDNMYGYSEISIGNNYTMQRGFGAQTFSTNLPFVYPATSSDIDMNVPYRAFVAMGGPWWSVQVGRDRLSWGNGVTGNLFLGDNLKYHNMARFTAFGTSYKYTFVTSFFPYPDAYWGKRVVDQGTNAGVATSDGIFMFMAHRLEWRMFHDKVGFTLTEGIMYQNKASSLDLRVLSPAVIYHDLYIRSNANSLLGLELDWTPWVHFNIYGQVVMDEFAASNELVGTGAINPNAMGYLLGLRFERPVGTAGVVAKASLEAAYTDPYLYLRDDGDYTQDSYGLGYVVALREFHVDNDFFYHTTFLGYRYGCDAIVFNLNGGLKQFGKWSVEGNGFFMIHGTHDAFTAWTRIGRDDDNTSPTTSHQTMNFNDSDAQTTRNAASYTMVVGIKGNYTFTSHLNLFCQTDYLKIWNWQNSKGSETDDLQVTVGVTYSL